MSDVLAADSAWSAHWRDSGFVRAFVTSATTDAFYLTPGRPILRGAATVAQLVASETALASPHMLNRPLKAGVSADATLGYTCGYTVEVEGKASYDGRYLAVWKRVDGAWRLAAFVLTRAAGPSLTDTMSIMLDTSATATAGVGVTVEAARAAAMRTDSLFSARATSTSVADAFRHYAALDAVSLIGAKRMTLGPEAIHDALLDTPPGMQMQWAPIAGDAAASGDLAFTVGEATLTVPATATTPARQAVSKYVTVWQRQANGEWRFLADGGNSR